MQRAQHVRSDVHSGLRDGDGARGRLNVGLGGRYCGGLVENFLEGPVMLLRVVDDLEPPLEE